MYSEVMMSAWDGIFHEISGEKKLIRNSVVMNYDKNDEKIICSVHSFFLAPIINNLKNKKKMLHTK